MIKDQVKNSFDLDSNSRTIRVQNGGRTFSAYLNFAFKGGSPEKAGVKRRSRQPHLVCYSGDVKYDSGDVFADLVTGDIVEVLKLDADGTEVSSVPYRVDLVDCDLTDESYQADIWLMVIPS